MRNILSALILAASISSAHAQALVAHPYGYPGEPQDSFGNIAATSYQTMPFWGNILEFCFDCSAGDTPMNTFWAANASSFFNTPALLSDMNAGVVSLESQSKVAMTSAQGGQDYYIISFPYGTFPPTVSTALGNGTVSTPAGANPTVTCAGSCGFTSAMQSIMLGGAVYGFTFVSSTTGVVNGTPGALTGATFIATAENSGLNGERLSVCASLPYPGNTLGGSCAGQPEWATWGAYVFNRPQYQDVAGDGGCPCQTRSDGTGASAGFIDFGVPLAQADCPPLMVSCTWGDYFAYLIGTQTKKSWVYGISLSDFSDSLPTYELNYHPFTTLLLNAFAVAQGYSGGVVPTATGCTGENVGNTNSEQACWITKNAFSLWVDWNNGNWARFFGALAARMSNTGVGAARTGLVIDQCGMSVAQRRLYDNDGRIIAQNMSPAGYICTWDNQTTQVGRSGPIAQPPSGEFSGAVLAAAREPLVRNGPNYESMDSALCNSGGSAPTICTPGSAIGTFYPSLTGAQQVSVANGIMKRLWFWGAWAHIADRNGAIRRAAAYASRDYNDGGTLAGIDPNGVLNSVIPTRPFGAAVYYSDLIERAMETTGAIAAGVSVNGVGGTYMQFADLQTFLDGSAAFAGGAAAGYYVSDAALPTVSVAAGNAPFAWVVVDPQALLTGGERTALGAACGGCTVVDAVSGAAAATALHALSGLPLACSGGIACYGFYDQNGRLIIVASNPSTAAAAGAVAGNISLASTGLSNGSHTATNLETNGTQAVTFSGGAATIAETIQPWDTVVLAVQ